MRRLLLAVALGFTLLLAGCSGSSGTGKKDSSKTKPGEQKPKEKSAPSEGS